MMKKRQKNKLGISSMSRARMVIENAAQLLARGEDVARKDDAEAAEKIYTDAADRLHEANEFVQKMAGYI